MSNIRIITHIFLLPFSLKVIDKIVKHFRFRKFVVKLVLGAAVVLVAEVELVIFVLVFIVVLLALIIFLMFIVIFFFFIIDLIIIRIIAAKHAKLIKITYGSCAVFVLIIFNVIISQSERLLIAKITLTFLFFLVKLDHVF